MSARAKSPPGKAAKGKAEASPEEVAAAEAARLTARADGLEADKAREAADRNYAQLERVRPSRTRRETGARAGSVRQARARAFHAPQQRNSALAGV
jgi:hypothetical protein